MRNSGDHARCAVGRRSHYAAARGVLLVHRHGIDRHPIQRSQRIASLPIRFLLAQPRRQPMRSPPHIQSARQNAFSGDAALARKSFIVCQITSMRSRTTSTGARFCVPRHQGALVLKHELADRKLIGVRRSQQLCRAVKRKWNRSPAVRLRQLASAPSSAMNPPPIEKNVRSSSTAPAASKALQTKSVGMLRARTRRKHDCSLKDQVACFIECESHAFPPSFSCLVDRIAATVDSIAAGIDR